MSLQHLDSIARIDHTLVEQVRQLEAVRPGVLRQLVGMFEQNTARMLADIETRVQAGDADALRIAFHSLKGTAASLGAMRLSQLAAIAERTAAGDGDAPLPLADIIAALKAEFAATRSALSLAAGGA